MKKLVPATYFLLALIPVAKAQVSPAGPLPPEKERTVTADPLPAQNERTVAPDYQIGPGDVLAITVSDAPEFSGKFRVNQSGFLEMPSLPSPVKAQGKTPTQLANDLRQALEDAKLYRNPTINIFVDEYHSQTVTVVGAVAKPSIYPLQKRTTLLEVISQAGGLLPTAGNKITIVPGGASESTEETQVRAATTIELSKLVRGDDPSLNVEVRDGDVVSVSTAEVVYVVGSVNKPGGYVLPDQSAGITVLQALAMSQGPNSLASTKRGMILRRGPDGTEHQNIPVDLQTIMEGKAPDRVMEANDILFVPVSGTKQTLHVMGEVAMSMVNGVAFYGVGYRVGTL